MAISSLPPVPTRADPENFSSKADAFLSALPTFADEANALQVDVNAKQVAAAASQVSAAAAQAAAEAASNATIWISGTTYAVGNVRFSPINFKSYRRKTAGAGTTDPSADSTNWQLLTGLGDVDLSSTQTLTNKTHSTGSIWNGTAVPIANGGTGATTAADAFTAIKQDASETATGVVELATTAEAAAGTDSTRVVTAAGVEAWGSTAKILGKIAAASSGDIGTYAFATRITATNVAFGSTVAGSDLRTISAVKGENSISSSETLQMTNGATLTGTWRCMGNYTHTLSGSAMIFYGATLWLRIA